jgi:hypothetical protein
VLQHQLAALQDFGQPRADVGRWRLGEGEACDETSRKACKQVAASKVSIRGADDRILT